MHDVVVIGAGPAGLHAARLLSERGLDVIVLEEHEAVGRPVHCTGILAREAFDEFGLARDTILNPLRPPDSFRRLGAMSFIAREASKPLWSTA